MNTPRRTVLACLLAFACAAPAFPEGMERVRVSADKKGFVLEKSGTPFVPWGFNYDHDDAGRLIEDYWDADWPTVEAHFAQMKKLGAKRPEEYWNARSRLPWN